MGKSIIKPTIDGDLKSPGGRYWRDGLGVHRVRVGRLLALVLQLTVLPGNRDKGLKRVFYPLPKISIANHSSQ